MGGVDTERFTAILARLEAVETRIDRLERRRGPRDDADRALLDALACQTLALPFTVGHLMAHTRTHPELRAALLAADVETTADLGYWLRGMVGEHDGLHVERAGRLWQVYRRSADGCAASCQA